MGPGSASGCLFVIRARPTVEGHGWGLLGDLSTYNGG